MPGANEARLYSHSFSCCLLSTYYALSPFLSAVNIAVHRTTKLLPLGSWRAGRKEDSSPGTCRLSPACAQWRLAAHQGPEGRPRQPRRLVGMGTLEARGGGFIWRSLEKRLSWGFEGSGNWVVWSETSKRETGGCWVMSELCFREASQEPCMGWTSRERLDTRRCGEECHFKTKGC